MTGNLPTMRDLAASDHEAVRDINIGGLHHQPGRTERLPYVFLSDDEFALLQSMASDGARVRAQDLPTSAAVNLPALKR